MTWGTVLHGEYFGEVYFNFEEICFDFLYVFFFKVYKNSLYYVGSDWSGFKRNNVMPVLWIGCSDL